MILYICQSSIVSSSDQLSFAFMYVVILVLLKTPVTSSNQARVIAKNPHQQFVKFVNSPQQNRVEQQQTTGNQQQGQG